jgi:hypothetical protein
VIPLLRHDLLHISHMSSRRRILTSYPADKNDRDIREVIIDFDESAPVLPIGFRVLVIFFK